MNDLTTPSPTNQNEIDSLLAAMRREADRQRVWDRINKILAGLFLALALLYFTGKFTGRRGLPPIEILGLYWFQLLITRCLNGASRKRAVAAICRVEDMR